ncbi:MAG TPA: dynamin family protein [Micromonosporaceae bacterium]|jgi:predicted GTPase/gas vesicle protein|nr:dynamin family protein [Micromonosporaceae bacterium]
MTAAATAERGDPAKAAAVVDLGLRACEAYGRTDLTARLSRSRAALADPAVHIVVAGEFKQGKSSLVNALVGASVCPVDDDVATAMPTFVRHGAEPGADLVFDGEPPRRQPVPLDQVRRFVVEGPPGAVPSAGERLARVDIRLPRKLLANGLVLIDTPGVGGLGSVHAAASLAAISLADAVLFVTDASQELTRSEVDFLRQARRLCTTVVCVLTKTDFYPAWRTIHQLNERHLRGTIGAPLIAVSSPLRLRAVRANDAALNTESGFTELVRFVTDRVAGGAAQRLAADAAAEVSSVCEQLTGQFAAERAALADPQAAQRVVHELTAVRDRVEALKSAAARWNQTLNDGIADLTSDVDHDMRNRIRGVVQEADDAIELSDPADTWAEMESWLRARTSYELLANYGLLRQRAAELSDLVAEHFREASGDAFRGLAVYNPDAMLSRTAVEHKIELARMTAGKQAMVALKSAYGGALMFTMLGSLMGVALGPIGVGIGLVMGHKGLRDEKKRQVVKRRTQAKNAMRRYCDEVSFVMGKDSRDTLRRVQRQLRDHYSALAEELNRSNSEALTAAAEAAKRSQTDRDQRLKNIDAELARLRQLQQRAQAVTGR